MNAIPHLEYRILHGDCLAVDITYLESPDGPSAVPPGAEGLLAATWGDGESYTAPSVDVVESTGKITHTIPTSVTTQWPVGKHSVRIQVAIEANDCRTTVLTAAVHVEPSPIEIAAGS